MDDIQAQMGAILNDPEMMQKIAAMAQSMQMPSAPPQEQPDPEPFEMPNIDIGMIQKLSGFASQSGIDKNQKNLLNALGPYLHQERISKLEKAMRAAKMARLATTVFGQSGFLSGVGR